MSKGRNLLSYYPIVKRPKAPEDSPCPSAKRLRVLSPQIQSASAGAAKATAPAPNKWLSNQQSLASILGHQRKSVCKPSSSSGKSHSGSAATSKNKSQPSTTIDSSTNDDVGRSGSTPPKQMSSRKYSQAGPQVLGDVLQNVSKSSMMAQLVKKGQIGELKETINKLHVARERLAAASAKSKATTSTAPTSTVTRELPEVPAYQRFHALATSDSTSQLALPYCYKFLAEVFRCTDTVAAIVHNRQEVCTFTKLKSAVQEMMRRNFELKHLGQIKTVYPAAYHFKQEKILSRNGSSSHPAVESQLTVSINKDCFSESQSVEWDCNDERTETTSSTPIDPGLLLSRRLMFRGKLVDILLKEHAKYLASLDPPIRLSSEKIHRWHPSFPIEKVPDVAPAALPVAESSIKYVSAKDVLNKVKGLYSRKLDKALENVAKKTAMIEEEERSLSETRADAIVSVTSDSRLKGIPPSLLAKIRAKEAEKLKAEMTRDPESDRRKVMISRLPEIVRILRNYFVAERKAAIPLGSAVKKIGESFIGSLTPVELEDHLKLLTNVAPTYLQFVTIKTGVFLKLNRQADLNLVIADVAQMEKAIL